MKEAKKTIYEKLINFQKEFEGVTFDKHVKSKDGKVMYRYASIQAIQRSIKEPLLNNNLVIVQKFDENNRLITELVDVESGDKITSSMEMIEAKVLRGGNLLQDMGSVITYLKRYQIVAILNISAEEDTDGNGLQFDNRPELEDSKIESVVGSIKSGKTTIEYVLKTRKVTKEQESLIRKLLNDDK